MDDEPSTEHTDRIGDGYAAEAAVDAELADEYPEYRSAACDHDYPTEWINLGAGDAIEVCGGCAVALEWLRAAVRPVQPPGFAEGTGTPGR